LNYFLLWILFFYEMRNSSISFLHFCSIYILTPKLSQGTRVQNPSLHCY
jgi:hypothetical protein